MPGFLLHLGATMLCSHAGQAQPTLPQPRVLVSGQPGVTITGPWVIAGCTMPPPAVGTGPCVSAQFVTAATRVLAAGQPVLLMDSQAVCMPTGTLLVAVAAQMRVSGM
jgi:hypothetical protein